MTSNCACGAVSVSIDTKPDFIHDCNCSLCRKSGGAWGYFSSASLKTSGETISYSRGDRAVPGVAIRSCSICAVTTHWVLTEAFKKQNPDADQVGVNMKLFDPDDLQGVEVRFPDGKAWTGEGAFTYRRPSMTISDILPW